MSKCTLCEQSFDTTRALIDHNCYMKKYVKESRRILIDEETGMNYWYGGDGYQNNKNSGYAQMKYRPCEIDWDKSRDMNWNCAECRTNWDNDNWWAWP